MATRNAYGQPQVGTAGDGRQVKTLGGVFSVLTTDEVTSQTLGLFIAPKGFVCSGIYLALTDIDTNGTPTVSVTVGDAGNTARFVAASNIGQAGGSTSALAAAGTFYEFTADTEVFLNFATGSATAAAGTVTCYMTGFVK